MNWLAKRMVLLRQVLFNLVIATIVEATLMRMETQHSTQLQM